MIFIAGAQFLAAAKQSVLFQNDGNYHD